MTGNRGRGGVIFFGIFFERRSPAFFSKIRKYTYTIPSDTTTTRLQGSLQGSFRFRSKHWRKKKKEISLDEILLNKRAPFPPSSRRNLDTRKQLFLLPFRVESPVAERERKTG